MAEIRYIRDIMKKDVVSMPPDKLAMDAAKKMSEKKISCVVVTVKGKPKGLITERDFIRRVIAAKKDPEKLKLKDIMTKDPIVLEPDTTIVHAARVMKKRNIRRFPVVNKGVLVGIITETDILDGMIETIKHLNWKLVNTRMAMEEFMNQIDSLLM